MTARVPTGDSEVQAANPNTVRVVEAAHWFRQGNRRLRRGWGQATGLEAEVAKLEAAVAAFEQSTSWRLTKPLRWLKRLMDARHPPIKMAPRTAGLAADLPVVVPPIREPFLNYAAWIANDEAVIQDKIHPTHVGRTTVTSPRFTLILTAIESAPEALAANLDSLRGQTGPSCSVIAACGSSGVERKMLEEFVGSEANATVLVLPQGTTAAEAKTAALTKAGTGFIGFLDLPDRIARAAVRLIGQAIALDPETEVIFGDEDTVDVLGQRRDPFFKPGWDPELHRAGDLLGRLVVLRGDLLSRIRIPTDVPNTDWFRELGKLAVAACRPSAICHIPAVLCHRAIPFVAADRETGAPARWSTERYSVSDPRPFVSVIVPTKDRAELLRNCADGVLNGTDYPRIELLILDNGSQDPAAIKLLRELEADERVQILTLPGPFNWSVLNNAGARAAQGDILILMNNDITVLHSSWVDEMVSYAMRPEIGAVGAKLLYPDGTLQHAGMVIDTDGMPKHVLRYAAADTKCMNGTFGVAHSVSILTGACLALRRSVFLEVGGLDESLAVACNDVDLCLRLLAHGYRNIWTPFAVLEHQEQASRGQDRTPAMRERAAAEFRHLSWNWGGALLSDRYFNPNLVLIDEQPRLRFNVA